MSDKTYTARDTAIAILDKAKEMIKAKIKSLDTQTNQTTQSKELVPMKKSEDKGADHKVDRVALPEGQMIPKTKENKDGMQEAIEGKEQPKDKAHVPTMAKSEKKPGHMKHYNAVSQRLKQMKGVHKPTYMDSYESGTSDVGARMPEGGKIHPETNKWAKEEHKKVLGELKASPKPKLEKAKMDEGKSPKEKADSRFERNKPLSHGSLEMRHVKGVHKPAFGDKGGTSNMGAHSNDQTRKEHVKRVSAEAKDIKPKLEKAAPMAQTTAQMAGVKVPNQPKAPAAPGKIIDSGASKAIKPPKMPGLGAGMGVKAPKLGKSLSNLKKFMADHSERLQKGEHQPHPGSSGKGFEKYYAAKQAESEKALKEKQAIKPSKDAERAKKDEADRLANFAKDHKASMEKAEPCPKGCMEKHEHIGWGKLHGKLEREGYSKESADKIAGSIKAKVHPGKK